MLKNNFKEKWMYEPKEGEQFFFIHIPKTGGTTLRKMLTNHFPTNSYYPTEENLLKNNGKYIKQSELVSKNVEFLQKALIIGHYNYDMVQYLKPDVKIVAFLRNPFDRIFSHIAHILKHDERWFGADPNDVVKDRIHQLGNLQTRMLGKSNSKTINDKLANIQTFDFIGIQERFAESISMLNELYNWKLEIVERQNTTQNSIKNSITSKSMALICRHIKHDIVLYDFACELFESRIQ